MKELNYMYEIQFPQKFLCHLLHQVVVASFVPGHQLEQKPKKPRVEHVPMTAAPIHASPIHVSTTSAEDIRIGLGGVKPILTPAAFQMDSIFGNGQPSDDEAPFPEEEEDEEEEEPNTSYADAEVAS